MNDPPDPPAGPDVPAAIDGPRLHGSRWDAPTASLPGTRPLLATVATWAYAGLGVGILGLAFGGTSRPAMESDARLLTPVALYCGALAYGASRLRARSSRRPASAWLCAPLLLHALAGALGAVAIGGSEALLPWATAREYALGAAFYGLLFGAVPAFVPLVGLARGRTLFLAALAGPVVLVVSLVLL